MGRESSTVVVTTDRQSSFFRLLTDFLAAYNRRTDVMERAVKLDERIRAATSKLDTAGNELQDAIKQNKP